MKENVTKSLESLATGYSIFEKNQVLTHDQLNSLAGYFDDQDRLTRVKLLGVGIACGLKVEAVSENAHVRVTAGAGITTDGDILSFNADTVFDQFKLYDNSYPVYPPFYPYGDGKMIPAYELIRSKTIDERALPLSQLKAKTGWSLANMAAVLLMESYVKDPDLCSGTDCDNLGKDYVTTVRLLLVDQSSAHLLQEAVTTPDQAARELKPITVNRPLLSASTNSPAKLAEIYHAANRAVNNQLIASLSSLYSVCSAFLADLFPVDPAQKWTAQLRSIQNRFAFDRPDIQYYYDFLKDVAETYNDFRERLFGDTTWCGPDAAYFPKHLLLGSLDPNADSHENRTGWYPSPLTSRTADQLDHARFLVQKLDALIRNFNVSSTSEGIRITPSLFEDSSLEERAIPYYYRVDSTTLFHQYWNNRLHQRGMDAYNYSYHAAAYNAQGGAAFPLTSQIGRFPFFRIEGHLGQNVKRSLSTLEQEIQSKNLPFVVRTVLLGDQRTALVKPGTRYTDLHRMHYLLRQDVSNQLKEVERFSGHIKRQVGDAATAGILQNASEDYDGLSLTNAVQEKDDHVRQKAASAQGFLNQNYGQYKRTGGAWKENFRDVLQVAGEFKRNISKVAKTEFTTPFDTLIGNTQVQWIDWLDGIIDKKDQKEDEKLLFGNFFSQHPGMEHFAGVARGGTFILVYNDSGVVVADFMLPYLCCDTAEEEEDEAPLEKPAFRPESIVREGITIRPSLDKVFFEKFTKFRGTLGLDKDVVIPRSGPVEEVVLPRHVATNELKRKVQDVKKKSKELENLRQEAAKPDLTEEAKTDLARQAKMVEAYLAVSIGEAANQIAQGGMDDITGSEGIEAVSTLKDNKELITDADIANTLNMNLVNVQNKASNDQARHFVGRIMG